MAEINQFLSSEAQKEVEAYIASLEVIASKYKDIATASLQLEKAKQEEAKTDNLLIKNKQQLEVLAQKKIKTQSDEQKASEKLTKAIEKENSEYEKLKRNQANAVKNAREMAAAYGVNSQRAREAAAEAKKYSDQLKRVNDTTGAPATNNVGKYFQAIMKGAGVLGLVTGGAQLASQAFNKLKTSSQAFGDAFDEAKGGVNAQMSKFFSMLGTGDFSNFVQNMRNASKAGRELADAMDNFFESNLGLQTAESVAQSLIQDQIKIRMSVLSTKDERIAAAKEINRIEASLTAQRMAVAQKEFDAYADNIETQTGLDRQQLIQFIESYNQQDELRERVVAKLKAIQKLEGEGVVSTGNIAGDVARNIFMKTTQGVDGLIASINQSFTAEERKYADFLQKYEKTTDESVTNVITSWNKLRDVKTAEVQETQRNNRQLASFEKELAEERIKTNEKIIESEEKKYNAMSGASAVNFDQPSAAMQTVEEWTKANEQIYESDKEFAEKRIEIEQKVKEARQQFAQDTVAQAGELASALFDIQIQKLDDETAAINESYSKRLDNEMLSQEQRDAIEAERDRKIAENEKKKRELEKRAFLIEQAFKVANIIMNTQQAISLAMATIPPPFDVGFILRAKIQGALALATVLAQSVPKFDKGSDYTPSTFWAGEKRPEFVRKNKRTMFVDKPTLFSGDEWKGSQVISSADTEKILANEHNKALRSAVMGGRKSDNSVMMINALNGIKSEVKKQRLNVRVNSSQDIKSTIWYKNIRN